MKKKNNTKCSSALIIIDAQNDFMPGGALAVPDGDKIIPVINNLLSQFDLVIFTLDWHPANHKSFASQHKGKDIFDRIKLESFIPAIDGIEQVLWPDHCIEETEGARLHKDIELSRIKKSFYFFKKGINPEVDSYSGFYDNQRVNSTGLYDFLNERDVETLFICGLAFEYCVAYTAIDAALEGFDTYVVKEGTVPFDSDTVDEVLNNFEEAGVKMIDAWNIPMLNAL